jgi:hypothetical protein
MLSREQITQIRAELTLGDAMAAEQITQDEREKGLRAFHRRAQKLGFVNGATYEDFLDLVRVEDLKAITAPEITGPLDSVPGLSPPSAASGE